MINIKNLRNNNSTFCYDIGLSVDRNWRTLHWYIQHRIARERQSNGRLFSRGESLYSCMCIKVNYVSWTKISELRATKMGDKFGCIWNKCYHHTTLYYLLSYLIHFLANVLLHHNPVVCLEGLQVCIWVNELTIAMRLWQVLFEQFIFYHHR